MVERGFVAAKKMPSMGGELKSCEVGERICRGGEMECWSGGCPSLCEAGYGETVAEAMSVHSPTG